MSFWMYIPDIFFIAEIFVKRTFNGGMECRVSGSRQSREFVIVRRDFQLMEIPRILNNTSGFRVPGNPGNWKQCVP